MQHLKEDKLPRSIDLACQNFSPNKLSSKKAWKSENSTKASIKAKSQSPIPSGQKLTRQTKCIPEFSSTVEVVRQEDVPQVQKLDRTLFTGRQETDATPERRQASKGQNLNQIKTFTEDTNTKLSLEKGCGGKRASMDCKFPLVKVINGVSKAQETKGYMEVYMTILEVEMNKCHMGKTSMHLGHMVNKEFDRPSFNLTENPGQVRRKERRGERRGEEKGEERREERRGEERREERRGERRGEERGEERRPPILRSILVIAHDVDVGTLGLGPSITCEAKISAISFAFVGCKDYDSFITRRAVINPMANSSGHIKLNEPSFTQGEDE
ncbi:hypothetical protein QZH41_006337 [Actinostola sp. cb2023]|nr:hypothetical protein QZH41_006337 [Actinostola sp. cb2023]